MTTLAYPKRLSPFYPGIVTARFYETWDFYTEQLGFRTAAETNTFVHLVHPTGAQLAVLKQEVDGNPAELVSATTGRGIWLNLEVPNVELEHRRLFEAGVPIVSAPDDKPWGERVFVMRDPNGILIYVAQRPFASSALESARPPSEAVLT